jgi:hypothetical protein
VASAGQPSTRRQSQYIFNPGALPTEVRDAFNNRSVGGVITKSLVAGPFQSNQLRYYIDGTDRLFLKDGTLFLLESEEPNEKAFLKDIIPCRDNSHAGIRRWYNSFVQHCMDHGYYAHPLYCFRKDHGGPWGFTFGASAEDDLPQRMQLAVQGMSHTIFRALQKKEMFPSGSQLNDLVVQCYPDGYKALKLILYSSHPAFHEQPATLITRYPTQQSESLVEYHSLFIDYLQLRAFIHDTTASLDQTAELDVFITGAKHGDFLNQVTREERQRSSMQHRYTGDQIVETLLTFLRAPHSPVVAIVSETSELTEQIVSHSIAPSVDILPDDDPTHLTAPSSADQGKATSPVTFSSLIGDEALFFQMGRV